MKRVQANPAEVKCDEENFLNQQRRKFIFTNAGSVGDINEQGLITRGS